MFRTTGSYKEATTDSLETDISFMHIKENISLQNLNTLSVPSMARFFSSVKSQVELREAVSWAQQKKILFHILGGGSNTIPQDYIDGLVIQPKLYGIDEVAGDDGSVLLTAGAGENWHELVMYCVKNEYYGVENLALIPGDCGAAPIQNIGAYGVELKDVFFELKALNIATQKIETLSNNDCKFSYRNSIFKSGAKGKYIITSITLSLSTKKSLRLDYKALKAEASSRGISDPSLGDVADMVIAIRSSKLPNPSDIPNAGSFFKNPIVDLAKYKKLIEDFPDLVFFPVDKNTKKIAAAWLLDKLGWKGKMIHGVSIHKDHALVLTNPACLSASKILMAADEIAHDVKKVFDITLEIEPQVLGGKM